MRLFRRGQRTGDGGDGPGDGDNGAASGAAGDATERALDRTRRSWFGRLASTLRSSDVTDDLWESLEEVLIGADTGVGTAMAVLERVRAAGPRDAEELRALLRDELVAVLNEAGAARGRLWDDAGGGVAAAEGDAPAVVLVVGVNGTGKTTAIARLARAYQREGATVLCAAGDTYRAAAIKQLQTWGERLHFDVVAHQQGADAAAVVFDAIDAARARGVDVAFVDTAGRLQNRQNLMDELAKIGRVIERALGRSADEVLLVLDAGTGQNGLEQARVFTEAVGVTGVMLTKLDGTARGGIAFAVAAELGLPVRFVGTGQGEDDLAPFDPQRFVDALLAEPASAEA